MLYVALGLVVALCAVTIAFTSILRWTVRQQARERERLVDQLCYLAGRTWNDPPSHRTEPELDLDRVRREWESPAPEQMEA